MANEYLDKTGLTHFWDNIKGEIGNASDAQVDDWLDRHPEATTTVQDGSVTNAKLFQGTNGILSQAIKSLGATYDYTDADQFVENSVYYISPNRVTSNYPTGLSACYLMTLRLNATNVVQVAYDAFGTKSRMRTCANGTWSGWVSFAISDYDVQNPAKLIINNRVTYDYTDANQFIENSVYYIGPNRVTSNYPTGLSSCYLMTLRLDATNVVQVAYDAFGAKSSMRSCANGTWSGWVDFVTNKNKLIINNGATYDYTDADQFVENSVYYISPNRVTSNYPTGLSSCYLMTVRLNATNVVQIAYDAFGTKSRMRSCANGTWSGWVPTYDSDYSDLGDSTIALFQNVGCCGDSFTAGYLYNKPDTDWYDPNYVPNGEYPAISYPKVMGRLYGINATLFAKGGLTTTTWRTDSKGLPALLNDTAKELYIICLGLNDRTQNIPIGVQADIDTEPMTPTYLGNMGAIIRAIQTHAPLSKIVLLKSPWVFNANSNTPNVYYNYSSSAIELLSTHLGIPYIETLNDPFFCSSAYVNGLKGLHPTAPLYAAMGKRIGELIGKCIIKNPSYFFNFYIPNV